MNRNVLATIILAALVAAASFGFCRYAFCAKPGVSLSHIDDASWLKSALGLSGEQAQAIAKLQSELGHKLSDCDNRNCAARCRLGAALFAATNSPEQLRALVDEMSHAQAESELATLKHIRAVDRLLTPDQQKRYEKLVNDCVCTMCQNNSSSAEKQR